MIKKLFPKKLSGSLGNSMVSPLLAVSCFVGPTACLERDKSELVSVGGANTLGWGAWSLTWLEYWLFVTSQRAQLCV